MAFKLTKADMARRDDLINKLSELRDELEQRVEDVNDALDTAVEALRQGIVEYNELLEEARGFTADIVSQAQEDIADKSERWQESERGEAAQGWADEWENAYFEDVETPQIERIDLGALDHDGVLGELPECAD